MDTAIFVYLVALWFTWRILLVLYNVSPFHKLSGFPGPKLAAASYLYEAYFDLWLGGKYGCRIREMHEIYGPIVRINPDELHCADPQFADQLYGAPGHVRHKWQHHVNGFGGGPLALSSFATVSHDLHHVRRVAVSKFFSRQQMLKLEHEVLEFAHMFIAKILDTPANKPVEMRDAFNCFTADVISQYAFGKPMGFIAQDGWDSNFSKWTKPFFENTHVIRHIAPARLMSYFLPWTADYLGQDMKMVMQWMTSTVPGYVRAALANPEKGRLFADMMNNKTLPESEKAIHRLSGEGVGLMIAGSETTGGVLAVLTYYLLSQPENYARLMEDLQNVDTSNIKWLDLERRPYLWATIQETLRIMPSIAQRSGRISPTECMQYRSHDGTYEWSIPKNTPVSMMAYIAHMDKRLFPDPERFDPERWLVDGQPNYKLSRTSLVFGKGSRSCIGENLAYCELYILTAFLAFYVIPRAQLYDTTHEDIAYDHDAAVIFAKKGPISVRVTIK